MHLWFTWNWRAAITNKDEAMFLRPIWFAYDIKLIAHLHSHSHSQRITLTYPDSLFAFNIHPLKTIARDNLYSLDSHIFSVTNSQARDWAPIVLYEPRPSWPQNPHQPLFFLLRLCTYLALFLALFLDFFPSHSFIFKTLISPFGCEHKEKLNERNICLKHRRLLGAKNLVT